MIKLRSPREIAAMRPAGQLVAQAHRAVREAIRPGITTLELDAIIERLFEQADAEPLFKGYPGVTPFPAVTCISVNEEVVHGIPGGRELVAGDIVGIDTGCRLAGWCGDSAWTYPVGEIDDEKQHLLKVTRECLELSINLLTRKSLWSEVASEMQAFVEGAGLSVVTQFVGHGIGREMHEAPQVPNFYSDELRDKKDFRLRTGLVLAIEPMVNSGTAEVELLSDHWTVVTKDRKPSAHFEHTVALTADGPLLLTAE
ncbi:MAG: type I methionyl aminopeptidase [Planctomycetales bacterium]|nr:type I methionyl aminopeptidase [Planctomycetales bacterium]